MDSIKGGLFDHDGAPTHEFYEFADGFKDAQGMGKKLVALNNTYVATVPGTYNGSKNSAPSGWKMGKFTSSDARKVNAEYGVINVSATNIGTTNNGEPGDVVVGYFDKLPGLEDAKTKEIFGTNATNPKAIMVVNGLVGQTDKLVQLLEPRTDNGAFWQTAQDVTLTLAKPTDAAKLMLVDSKTGQQTEVTPKINEHNATVTLRLGGGQTLYCTGPPQTKPIMVKYPHLMIQPRRSEHHSIHPKSGQILSNLPKKLGQTEQKKLCLMVPILIQIQKPSGIPNGTHNPNQISHMHLLFLLTESSYAEQPQPLAKELAMGLKRQLTTTALLAKRTLNLNQMVNGKTLLK